MRGDWMSVKYFRFHRNGEAVFGSHWTKAPVKHMRNAFFKIFSEEDLDRLSGILLYQTTHSDEWEEKPIDCNSGSAIYRKIQNSFEKCSDYDFNRFISEGHDLYDEKKKEFDTQRRKDKEKADSMTYIGNQFIYSSHDEMVKPEKKDYYLRNSISDFHRMRSFLLEVEGETPTMFKTKILYLSTRDEEWKMKSKNFSKKKILSAYGSGLIEQTTEETLAKHYLLAV